MGSFDAAVNNRDSFDSVWEDLRPLPIHSAGFLWAILYRIAGRPDGRLDLARLASRLISDAPPPEVVQTDIGRTGGPVLSTIHAAKGREADTVHLMLPRYPEDSSKIDWSEEARVLFVAATRARRTLKVGSSSTWLRPMDGGRLWQRRTWGARRDAQVEVGLEGDVVLPPAGRALPDASQPEEQSLLWVLSPRTVELLAVRTGELYDLRVAAGRHEGRTIGRLSRAFSADLRRVSAMNGGSSHWLPGRIRGIYLSAVRTVVTESEGAAPVFRLAPVVSGLPVIYLDQNAAREDTDGTSPI
jgi:hypothetical protein